MRRDLLLLAALVLLIRLPFLSQPIQGDDVYYLAMARNGLVDPLHPMQMSYVYQGQQIWMAGHSHPPLNNYILCALLAIFGGVNEAAFHAVYILFSLLAVGAVYFLGRRLIDEPTQQSIRKPLAGNGQPRDRAAGWSTRKPLWAALAFLAVPAFVLSGNKLEADPPFLALWLIGFALFVHERPLWAALPLGLSGLAAYQAVFAAPILASWVWLYKPGGRWSWRQWPYALALLSPAIALAAWQLFEMASGAQLPAAQLAGYHTTWNLAGFDRRVRNALALTIHLGWFLFPLLAVVAFRLRRWTWTVGIFAISAAIAAAVTQGYRLDEKILVIASLGAGLCILFAVAANLKSSQPAAQRFLAAWVLIFFAAALAAFYAGAARYLLPLAAPLALLAVSIWRSAAPSKFAPRALAPLPGVQAPAPLPGVGAAPPPGVRSQGAMLAAAIVAQLALSLSLAAAYYQYISQYRDFAARLEPLVESRRLWFNADWGLRYYLESIGGEAALAGRPLQPHAALVSSRLGGTATVQTMGQRRELLRAEIRSGPLPLNVIGLESHSGNASAEFGLLPFDYGNILLDEVKAELIGFLEPTKSYLTMSDPEAENHLLLGFYQLESQQWRWIGPHATAVLRAPDSQPASESGTARDSKASPGTEVANTNAANANAANTNATNIGAANTDAANTNARPVSQPDISETRSILFELAFHIPETAPARTVTIDIDGKPLASQTYPGPGGYTFRAPVQVTPGKAATIEISVDQAFRVPGDSRDLGIIVTALGFVTQ